jgi:titin
MTTPPSPPSGLSATTASASQINLAWTASAGAVSTYRIEQKIGAGGTYVVIDSTASTAYSRSGLSSSTEYFYRVQACNSGGCSGYSNESSATTLAVPPGAPSNLNATPVSPSQINLSWAAASGVVALYHIERRDQNGSPAVIDSVAGSTTSYANGSGWRPNDVLLPRECVQFRGLWSLQQ